MRQLAGKFVAFLLVCCTILGISGREVKAEDKILSELTDNMSIAGMPFQDYGTSTKDGVLQISSNSHSLKAGDVVEVEFMFNCSSEDWIIGFMMDGLYNSDVLEFMYLDVEDEYKEKYRAEGYANSGLFGWVDKSDNMSDDLKAFLKNPKSLSVTFLDEANSLQGKAATAKYRVKKDTESLDLYYTSIEYTIVSGMNTVNEQSTTYYYYGSGGVPNDEVR